jgi:hypothetical protein
MIGFARFRILGKLHLLENRCLLYICPKTINIKNFNQKNIMLDQTVLIEGFIAH